jgi:hypothetical protein
MAKHALKDNKGRFTKRPISVDVDYDKESHLEHMIENLSYKFKPFTVEETIEAIRELETKSPIEKAVEATERRMRAYFNRYYYVWVIGTCVAVIASYALGYIS